LADEVDLRCRAVSLNEHGAISTCPLPSAIKDLYSDEMIREWFDTREAVAFARGIARDIDRLFPPAALKRKPTSEKKDQKKFDGLVLRTRTFAQQHRLNIYKKAKLLNTIKWELRDAGHEESLINEILALLTPLLT
jgi:hypothetical protein